MLNDAPVFAYVPVSDLARGRAYYEGVLGLPAREANDAGVTFECGGGSSFFMYASDGAGTNKASTLFWTVDDVTTEVAELKGRGVTFENYPDFPGMENGGDVMEFGDNKAAWFKDPDGNILAIIQSPS